MHPLYEMRIVRGGAMSDIMYDEIGVVDGKYVYGDWKRIAIHDEANIHGFFGPYRFLSNMWPCEVYCDGVRYPSVENAYQAAKFPQGMRRYFLAACDPYESKKVVRDMEGRVSSEEWNAKKVAIMHGLLLQKFNLTMNPELQALLRATGDRHMEETNWWGDTFWGCAPGGVGTNMLGILLMRVRYCMR
jgi:ribA/ribD-fused uncharacterized protein